MMRTVLIALSFCLSSWQAYGQAPRAAGAPPAKLPAASARPIRQAPEREAPREISRLGWLTG